MICDCVDGHSSNQVRMRVRVDESEWTITVFGVSDNVDTHYLGGLNSTRDQVA